MRSVPQPSRPSKLPWPLAIPGYITLRPLPVGCVQLKILRDQPFPAVAVRKQAFLVIEQLLARLRRKLEIRPLDDRIDRTRLLAETAIDALHHVDVVTRRASRPVFARLGFNRDGLRRADRLAQLARDAALFAARIPAQRMLAPESRR